MRRRGGGRGTEGERPFRAVATNVTRSFNKIVRECFPPGSQLHKLFNKNNLKLSYSTTMNMAQVISKHNKKVMGNGTVVEEAKGCNCRGGLDSCPVGGQCRVEGVLYKAVVGAGDSGEEMEYIGSTALEFKKRWANHTKSLRLEAYRHDTSLSTKYWSMREEGREPEVRWEILRKSRPYTPVTGRCNLCCEEKAAITMADAGRTLNRRNEIMGRCPHRRKHLLASRIRPPDPEDK